MTRCRLGSCNFRCGCWFIIPIPIWINSRTFPRSCPGFAPLHSSIFCSRRRNVMNVGVARTPYFIPTSSAVLMSTLTRTARSPASSASSSYVGYTILQGGHVADVKKMATPALRRAACANCSSSCCMLLTIRTVPWGTAVAAVPPVAV